MANFFPRGFLLVLVLAILAPLPGKAQIGAEAFQADPLLPASVYARNRLSLSHSSLPAPENPLFPPCPELPQGLDSSALDQWVSDAKSVETDALLLVKDGCTALEEHFGGAFDEAFSVQSVTKSVASLAIGTLVDQGKIASLDLPVATFLPEFAQDPQKRQITIRHLLTHTSGLGDWDAAASGATAVQQIANSHLLASPGAEFHYSSMAVYLLGPVIEAASGQPATDYFRTQLFRPLGAESAHFYNEQADTGGGLFMTTRDMLRFGKLMLDRGLWTGASLLSENWIAQSIRSSQSLFSDYGLLWWLFPRAPRDYDIFSAVGYQGQYITVYPQQRMIAVRVHRVEQTNDPGRKQMLYWEAFPPSLRNLLGGESR
jgi:CubicO group peptidase (beta-lactamase class C family)